MILARSLPDLSQEDEASSAAASGDEGAPADPVPYDHDRAEVPSFRPLSRRPTASPEKASLWKERSDALAIATPEPRALARSSIGPGAVAKRVDRTPDEGRLDRVPRFVGPSQRILLLCCVFLTGFAAGLSASRVLSFQDVRTALSSVTKALGLPGRREVAFLAEKSSLSGELAEVNELPAPTEPRASSLPAAALSGSPRPTVSGLFSDANRALSSTDNPKVSSEVTALEEQLERQLAEGRLTQPGNDNALDTYRKLAAIAPNDFPLAAILDSPEPSATERNASTGAGTPAALREAAALPTPVILGGAAEPVKPPEVALAASVVTSEPAGARSLGQATAPAVAQPSGRTPLGPEGPSAIIGIAMSRGDEALAAGDVISARQFYELAASNGVAHAATAVGRTYDPNFLQGKGVRGAFADAEAAKRWYQRAIDGGDSEARTLLDKLLKVDQGTPAR